MDEIPYKTAIKSLMMGFLDPLNVQPYEGNKLDQDVLSYAMTNGASGIDPLLLEICVKPVYWKLACTLENDGPIIDVKAWVDKPMVFTLNKKLDQKGIDSICDEVAAAYGNYIEARYMALKN